MRPLAWELTISGVPSTSNVYRDLTLVFDASAKKFKTAP